MEALDNPRPAILNAAMFINDIKELHPATARLLAVRMIRSVGQGMLIVDFTLYLNALHWRGSTIGIVLSAAGLFGAFLSLIVGVTSDRLKRKPFLIVYQWMLIAGCLTAVLTSRPWLIGISAVVAGFGRGANGAAGPFAPAEGAWLAENIRPSKRGLIYSMNTALGFFGTGFGALLAVLPSLLHTWFRGAAAYRPLFGIVGILAVIDLVLLASTEERYRGKDAARRESGHTELRTLARKENHALLKLVSANVFNGVAIGITGPLIAYWFAIKFHVGPEAIAPVMGITFFVTGIAALFTGRLTERMGIVKSVVLQRTLGLGMLLLFPIIPLYWLTALVYLLRSAFNRGTAGARQALAIGLVREERRAFATSLNAVSMQLPQAVGPAIAGYFFEAGQLVLPFYLAALFQGVYIVMYKKFFTAYDTPQDE